MKQNVKRMHSIATARKISYNEFISDFRLTEQFGRIILHMIKKQTAALLVLAILVLAAGCKTTSTTVLNTGSKIFYGGSQIETTVRELTVDGGTTSARVRFVNLGTEELGSLEALVEFIDATGEVIATCVISNTYTTPIAVGESVSETATCDSDSRIKGVYVSEYTPES